MIRYPEALNNIEAAVSEAAGDWLSDAARRTSLFQTFGRYLEEYIDAAGKKITLTPFWSRIKPVYMRRQHDKCVYCETRLEGKAFSTVQWDLEHFRPKSRVRQWPGKKSAYRYEFNTGDEWDLGYYLLAYHLHNYAVACKTCNTSFKSDYFPIAAARIGGMPQPQDYTAEEPFLIYPLGPNDEDPEDIITFIGAETRPKYQQNEDERKWRRARITIDFFDLNRDGLLDLRAWWLLHTVWPNFQLAQQGVAEGERNLARIRSERSPFTNCAKCFLTLCEANRPQAEALLPEFEKIVEIMEK